jgi:uncharacterized protein involved in response to NO
VGKLVLESRSQDAGRASPVEPWQPLALGFRPFFLLAGVAAVILMIAWLLSWHGEPSAAALYYGHIGWHTHEMLFGYVMAVIAGFLLTAVRNWTGLHTPDGAPLGLLAMIWIAGRVAPFLASVPPWLVAASDLLFIPLLGLALARPLWTGANRTNRWFLGILAGMFMSNLLVHAQALGVTDDTGWRGTSTMLMLTLLLLIFVGGRVMPFFTERAVAQSRPRRRGWVELAGIGAISLAALLSVLGIEDWPLALVALIAGLSQIIRLAGWHNPGVWRIPILSVLYAGYAWLAAGLLLLAASAIGWLPRSIALHALSAGAIGVFTLGMMARVTLGHTGRTMRASSSINLAFVLLNIGAAARVIAPLAVPAWYVSWVLLSGLLWTVAFGIFLFIYAPMLLRARIDGCPG